MEDAQEETPRCISFAYCGSSGNANTKCEKKATATVISRDDVEISRSFHRHTVGPTDDWSGESTEVQAMCNTFHTTEAIAAYNAAQSTEGV